VAPVKQQRRAKPAARLALRWVGGWGGAQQDARLGHLAMPEGWGGVERGAVRAVEAPGWQPPRQLAGATGAPAPHPCLPALETCPPFPNPTLPLIHKIGRVPSGMGYRSAGKLRSSPAQI